MKTLENKKFRDYNNIMNKNFLHNQPKPCPFKPGMSMTKECALFMENTCPMFQECSQLTDSPQGCQCAQEDSQRSSPDSLQYGIICHSLEMQHAFPSRKLYFGSFRIALVVPLP